MFGFLVKLFLVGVAWVAAWYFGKLCGLCERARYKPGDFVDDAPLPKEQKPLPKEQKPLPKLRLRSRRNDNGGNG